MSTHNIYYWEMAFVKRSNSACCIKISADNILKLKHFSYSSQKTGFDISSKLSPEVTRVK